MAVFGAIGGYDRGGDKVRQQTDFVASRFHGGQNLRIEPLAMGASGDLAYTVWIERGEVRVVGRDDYVPLALRATHIFRRENGTGRSSTATAMGWWRRAMCRRPASARASRRNRGDQQGMRHSFYRPKGN